MDKRQDILQTLVALKQQNNGSDLIRFSPGKDEKFGSHFSDEETEAQRNFTRLRTHEANSSLTLSSYRSHSLQ